MKRETLGRNFRMRCWWCSQQLRYDYGFQNTVTRDHVVPLSCGGPNQFWNIVAACRRCNHDRGNMQHEQWAHHAKSLKKDTRDVETAQRAYKLQKRAEKKQRAAVVPESNFLDTLNTVVLDWLVRLKITLDNLMAGAIMPLSRRETDDAAGVHQ